MSRGEVFHVPIDSVDVVLAAEELKLLESFGVGKIAFDFWVHLKERVKCCGPSFLRANHQKVGKTVTGFGLRPDKKDLCNMP